MLISSDQFNKLFPKNKTPELWVDIINAKLKKYELNRDYKNVAMFLAQCGHESMGFTVFKENLNYSADALLRVFPKYFKTKREAEMYARQPQKIANRVYANRMGNGDEASGDGWKYIGRSAIQCTGKHNYSACSEWLFGDNRVLLDNPDLLLIPEYAIECACWFWLKSNLSNVFDIKKATKIVNGGFNGLDDRNRIYENALVIFS